MVGAAPEWGVSAPVGLSWPPVQGPDIQPVAQPAGYRAIIARVRRSQGIRAGAIVAVSTLVLNASAYLYYIACIRYLGSSVYGDVAAMLALFALISLPLGSIQSLLAREVAQLPAAGVSALLRRATWISVVFGLGIVLVGFTLVDPFQDLLNISSREIVVAGISAILFAVVAAVFYGFLQGELRFKALGTTYALSGLARPVLVVPALLGGLGAAGALAVNTVAGALAVLIAGVALRDMWRSEITEKAPHLDRRQMAVMLIGSLAFASLTNIDILLAAYFLPAHLVGVYAAAALVGKAVLFLPSAVVTVLLPKAAERAAAGLTSEKILFASAAVTGALSLTATAILALIPQSLVVWAFGGDFRESTALLGWFGLAMTALALANVYLSVYFAERDARFPLLVLAAAVAQVIGVSLWHSNPRSIVIVTLGCGSTVLLLHELFFRHSLLRSWRRRRAVGAAVLPQDTGPPAPGHL
jgi:O-antigen/teichoic acid export membrane protein